MLSLRFVKGDQKAETLYLASSTRQCFMTQQELEPSSTFGDDVYFRIELTNEKKEIIKTWPRQGQPHFTIASSNVVKGIGIGRYVQSVDLGSGDDDPSFVYDFFDRVLHQIHVMFRKKDDQIAMHIERLKTWAEKKHMCGRVVHILDKMQPFHHGA